MSGTVGVDLSAGSHTAPALGVLAFRGPDAARFLQGQLSANIEQLAPGASTFAGFHNPQGRVIAILAVACAAPEELHALLPRELAADVAQRLGKFVLRAKVLIADESSQWRAIGVSGESTLRAAATFAWGARRVLLAKAGDVDALDDAVAREAWERADVAGGLPQVYAATRETFVAQMLNLDLLGAIAFDKGCYTGQEVIARAHYRGRVKRRLQRWHNPSGTPLAPGQAARSGDGRALIVVRAAPDGAGAQEILAVGAFGPAPAEAEATGDDTAAAPRVSGPLALPYELPV
jgi:folate-binding protein YgfZ